LFSTFIYILILFYQNLNSGLGYSFNSEINKINISILSKDYDKAISLINLIEKKYIFKNESIYKTKVLISIKRPTSFVNFNVNSLDDYIFKSFILRQNNKQETCFRNSFFFQCNSIDADLLLIYLFLSK
jgi:hypothetical protein